MFPALAGMGRFAPDSSDGGRVWQEGRLDQAWEGWGLADASSAVSELSPLG